MKKQFTPRSGFTLIELLTVIAIIGILAAILIPAVGQVRTVAQKMTSSSNIRSIALSYATYSTSGSKIKILTRSKLSRVAGGASVQGVAAFLAEKVDLTDSAMWIIDNDENVIGASNTIPPVIGYRDPTSNNWRADGWGTSIPVSYDFALGVGGNDPTSTTPLVWTRGLNNGGNWGVNTPWKRGGHIAFLDGHVQFYNELDPDEDGALTNPRTGSSTRNISEVIASDVSANKEILRASGS